MNSEILFCNLLDRVAVAPGYHVQSIAQLMA